MKRERDQVGRHRGTQAENSIIKSRREKETKSQKRKRMREREVSKVFGVDWSRSIRTAEREIKEEEGRNQSSGKEIDGRSNRIGRRRRRRR